MDSSGMTMAIAIAKAMLVSRRMRVAYSGLIRRVSGRGSTHGARRSMACLIAAALVAGLVAATALFPVPAMAQGNAPGRVKVLVEELTESTVADFARGQARGIAVAGEGEQARLQGQGGEFVSGVIALPFEATHLGLHWMIRGASPSPWQSRFAPAQTARPGQTGIQRPSRPWSNSPMARKSSPPWLPAIGAAGPVPCRLQFRRDGRAGGDDDHRPELRRWAARGSLLGVSATVDFTTPDRTRRSL